MATAQSSDDLASQARSLLSTLISDAGGKVNGRRAELISEIAATCVKLLRDQTSVGDIKILNTAFKELRYAFKVFSRYREVRKVSVFGSARTQPHDVCYGIARDFAQEITSAGFMVITGAGPGVMRACQEGAGREQSFGINIWLPFEQEANEFIRRDAKLVNFKYFFTRKILFVKEADAIVLFPGGFGTHDEAFEALTLVQTGKADPMPLVFVDVPRGTYWKTWERYVRDHLLRRELISEEDLSLFRVTDRVSDAVSELTTFYRVYHSTRRVGRKTVLRLARPVADRLLERLNDEFSDILLRGSITQGAALAAEANEGSIAHLPRLIMEFNRTNYGRLRQMIDLINRSSDASELGENGKR